MWVQVLFLSTVQYKFFRSSHEVLLVNNLSWRHSRLVTVKRVTRETISGNSISFSRISTRIDILLNLHRLSNLQSSSRLEYTMVKCTDWIKSVSRVYISRTRVTFSVKLFGNESVFLCFLLIVMRELLREFKRVSLQWDSRLYNLSFNCIFKLYLLPSWPKV